MKTFNFVTGNIVVREFAPGNSIGEFTTGVSEFYVPRTNQGVIKITIPTLNIVIPEQSFTAIVDPYVAAVGTSVFIDFVFQIDSSGLISYLRITNRTSGMDIYIFGSYVAGNTEFKFMIPVENRPAGEGIFAIPFSARDYANARTLRDWFLIVTYYPDKTTFLLSSQRMVGTSIVDLVFEDDFWNDGSFDRVMNNSTGIVIGPVNVVATTNPYLNKIINDYQGVFNASSSNIINVSSNAVSDYINA